MTTTYLSFTPAGGRIGRIAWSNGDEDTWGSVRWDSWWPCKPPAPSRLAKAVAAIRQVGIAMGKALAPAVQRAADASNAFGAAMAKAAQDEAFVVCKDNKEFRLIGDSSWGDAINADTKRD